VSLQTRTSWIAYGVLLVAALTLIGAVILPLWQPLFMAVVLTMVLREACDWIVRRVGDRPRLGAALVTVGVVFLLLLPFVVLTTVIVREAIGAYNFIMEALKEGGITGLTSKLPDQIERPLRRVVAALPVDPEQLSQQAATGGQYAAGVLTTVMRSVWHLLFSLVMFLIALYSLLVHGRQLGQWIEDISPLPHGETLELFVQFRKVARSVVGSSVVTAAAQGVTAFVGYLIAGVPNAVFFGVLTFFASFIPSVGTAVVAIPLAGLLLIMGNTWQALFLAVWATAVVGMVDNFLRPLLMSDAVALDTIVVFFSLIGGVIVFGPIGLVVGPLAVSFALTVIRFGHRSAGVAAADQDAQTTTAAR
jgi:predicted PurR-regulated permease PerM